MWPFFSLCYAACSSYVYVRSHTVVQRKVSPQMHSTVGTLQPATEPCQVKFTSVTNSTPLANYIYYHNPSSLSSVQLDIRRHRQTIHSCINDEHVVGLIASGPASIENNAHNFTSKTINPRPDGQRCGNLVTVSCRVCVQEQSALCLQALHWLQNRSGAHSDNRDRTLFDFQLVLTIAEPQVIGRPVISQCVVHSKHSSSRSKPARAGAHPSTAEEHARAGQEAQAESHNRNTSDEYLQDETEQKRTSRARTAFNIVFVTSEVSLPAALRAFLGL